MRIEITCSNRVGILQEIMGIFSEYRVNVASGELGGDSGDKVYLSAPGLLVTQFQAIEKSLQRVPGVRSVRRIALIPSERRHFELDTLLRHVAEPVLSVDRDGRIIAANLAAARALGVSLGQAPGMQLQRFLPRLQLKELLRGFTVPRYGLPVSVRGRAYTLDWSPIALADDPGAVASLAGAVITLQRLSAEEGEPQERPEPRVLWDLDKRREACLKLQQLAPLEEPLLISGEAGSGKTTFLQAAYYLCPLAETGQLRYLSGRQLDQKVLRDAAALGGDAVVLIDDLEQAPDEIQRLLAEHLLRGAMPPRLMVSAASSISLIPALRQLLLNQITLPPLRSMRPAIADFAQLILAETAGAAVELDDAVRQVLMSLDWPTNLRGLSAHLQGALAHAEGGANQSARSNVISLADLPAAAMAEQLPWQDWGRGLTLRQRMDKVERAILEEMLQALPAGQQSTRTLARQLGISHTAVANKLRKYGLG
ncbi:TyrR/PhhR family helix-turn-helix DNA-binding protein [Microbulbifer sp. ALW1]|uniref:TyrR/PhhR family helix-turn-helix DNA-binding protein n=1 Tax=Microbulbifer sp. (strain ALW1) TaxID=1516059 RepID=UPI00135BF36F|nr:TyrR/PhhR family helix-turn-helix DNA-binding protein [Microbulbifer sp. ALW1]